jgi:hypothetical protein
MIAVVDHDFKWWLFKVCAVLVSATVWTLVRKLINRRR